MCRRSRQGFTLVESALALAANSLVLLLVCSILQVVQVQDRNLQLEKNVEWHLFLNQMEEDTANKDMTLLAQQELRFKEQGSGALITYTYKSAEIVRQVYGQGYVPMLTGVKEVWYKATTGGIHIQVAFSNGQIFQGYVPLLREG